MNIYQIKEMLKSREKAVFTLNEFSRIIGKPKNVAAVYLNRMCNKGLLFRIEKNKVSLTDDSFIVASQLVFPSYLCLSTSLYLQGHLPQIVNNLYVMSSRQVKAKNLFGTKIIFLKINPRLMFGYSKTKKEESYVFISDLEKTIIDWLLYPKYCRVKDILNALKLADVDKLEEYLNIAKKEVLKRKIGFLLDSLKIKHNIKRTTHTIYKLNPKIKSRGKFNNKWFLYLNEELS